MLFIAAPPSGGVAVYCSAPYRSVVSLRIAAPPIARRCPPAVLHQKWLERHLTDLMEASLE